MKKFLSLIFITLIALVIGLSIMYIPDEDGEYVWNPFDYARITEVDYKAVVVDEDGSNGKVIITEQLTFEIHAATQNNLFWELWRDLPEQYVDGVKVDYKVNSVKQIFEDGSENIYQESPKLYWDDYDYINSYNGYGPGKWYHSAGPYNESFRQYECVFFYVDGIYRDSVTFEIEYEIANAAMRYNDSSELYLSMYSEDTIKYLTSFKGQVLIPNENMPSSGNYYANTYGTNSYSFPFIESTSINPGYYTFAFELDESQLNFKPYNQYIEFALVSHGKDKHIFTQNASKNIYHDYDALVELQKEQEEYDALPAKWRKIKSITLVSSLIGAILTVHYIFLFIKKTKEKHTFYQPTMKIDYFRDIPSDLDPNFASELVFCKGRITNTIENNYAATMLSLVYKGYIEIERNNPNKHWDSKNMKIIVKYQPNDKQQMASLKPLTSTEDIYFNLILRHAKSGKITLRAFQHKVSKDFNYTNAFVKHIKDSITRIGTSERYFQKAAYQKPKQQAKRWVMAFWIIGILVVTVGNIIASRTRLDLAFGSFFILGSAFIIGAIHLSKTSNSFVLLTQLGEDEYAKWRGLYNFLSSETLMHEKSAIDIILWEQYLIYATAFGISTNVIKALQIHSPNTDTSSILSNPYYRSRSFRYGSRSFRNSTRSASRTFRSSGHRGYSGGGRGGGGGGGGH